MGLHGLQEYVSLASNAKKALALSLTEKHMVLSTSVWLQDKIFFICISNISGHMEAVIMTMRSDQEGNLPTGHNALLLCDRRKGIGDKETRLTTLGLHWLQEYVSLASNAKKALSVTEKHMVLSTSIYIYIGMSTMCRH